MASFHPSPAQDPLSPLATRGRRAPAKLLVSPVALGENFTLQSSYAVSLTAAGTGVKPSDSAHMGTLRPREGPSWTRGATDKPPVPSIFHQPEDPKAMGPIGLLFHFVVVTFISGDFGLHISLHPHCVCTSEAWYPPCLPLTNYAHKVQVKSFSDSNHHPPNVGPHGLASGKAVVCQRGEVQGTQPSRCGDK